MEGEIIILAIGLILSLGLKSALDGFIGAMLYSREFWIALSTACFVLVGTAMYEWFSVWRPRKLLNLKEVFNDVKILNDRDICEYPQNPHFVHYPQARRYLKIHMAWRLWKKIEKTKKDNEKCVKKLYKNLSSVFVERCKNERLGVMFLTDGRGQSSIDYVVSKNVPLYLDEKNNGANASLELREGNGKYCILYLGRIANTTSKNKRNKIIALIESMENDAEIKKLFGERESVRRIAREAEGAFNKKLAKLVKNVKYRVGGL
jgi:hypothetical protein